MCNVFLFGQKNQKTILLNNLYTIENSQIKTTSPLKRTFQLHAPAVPYYKYTVEIPSKGSYELKITFLDSLTYENVHLFFSKGLEKTYLNYNSYDTTYYIEHFDSSSFFPKSNFKTFKPTIGRDSRFQTFHVFPFKYLSTNKTLKIYTRFSIELIKTNSVGENEILNERNYITTKNYYHKTGKTDFNSKYQAIGEEGEMLLVYRNTSDSIIQKFKHWKEQVGLRCHLLQLDNTSQTPEDIKAKITLYYDSIPDILYLQLIGDFNEIPSYLYKQFLTDDYYSDTYYAFIDGNDFIPELFVGRFSGTEAENNVIIDKSIRYEKYAFADNYEKNLMLIASDQGNNIGDDNETDWQHLRNIGIYLSDSVNMIPSEYFDGSQGELDIADNPTFTDIKNGINSGKGFLFYTGHGDFSVMNTGNFFTMHVKQLENYNQLPIVISVACNHGKYIGLDCMAEVFQNDTKNNQFTGSVAFTGSTILMAWAPPMETQDEFSRLMNPNEVDYKSTIGAAFYNAQLSMLEHYPTAFGEEVMQTWLLFGDPSLKMRVNQKGTIQVEHPSFIRSEETNLSFPINENNCFVSLSQNNQVIATGVSANNRIIFDNVLFNSNNPLELVATKPNHRTYIGNINLLPNSESPFTLFPIPTSKSLSIYGKYAIQNIAIYDVSGRIIVNFKDLSNNFINLETLSAGVYTLQIEANNTYYNYKIIKTNE